MRKVLECYSVLNAVFRCVLIVALGPSMYYFYSTAPCSTVRVQWVNSTAMQLQVPAPGWSRGRGHWLPHQRPASHTGHRGGLVANPILTAEMKMGDLEVVLTILLSFGHCLKMWGSVGSRYWAVDG